MSNYKHYSWSAINRITVQSIGFIGNIIIARQLTPDDYGLVAMLSILIGIAWNLTESGFADSLIRKQDPDNKDYSTIFVHNICIGLILYIILYSIAPYIADFFKRKELLEITRVLGLSIIIKAVSVTEFTRMRKELLFKNTAIIQILASIFSVITGYTFARYGYGYWAIVSQTISLGLFSILLIIVINKWKPYFYFSWSRFKEMRGFSNNMLLSYFTNQIGQNIYSVFIGKFHPTSQLGFFNQATKLNETNFQGINAIILTTSYSIVAKEKDRNKRRDIYNNILEHFLFIQFFISFIVIGSAPLIVEFVFGNKWIQTAPYLQLITISFLFIPLTTINSNILKTENRSDTYKNLTFLRNGLMFISLFITYKYSITIILYGTIIARYISVFIDLIVCGKIINLMPIHQLTIVLDKIYIPISAMLIAYFCSKSISVTFIHLTSFLLIYSLVFLIGNQIKKDKIQQYYLNFLKK